MHKTENHKRTFFLPVNSSFNIIIIINKKGNRGRKRKRKGVITDKSFRKCQTTNEGGKLILSITDPKSPFFFFFFRFYFLSLSLDLALALVLILSASFLLRCLFFPLARRGFLVFGDGRPLVASSSSSWILNFLGSCSSSDQTKETRKVQRAKWYG